MKNAYNYIIIFLFFITISCNRNNADNSSIIRSNTSYINPNSDSIFYKLDLYTKNDNYFRDSQDNLTFLITRTITAFGKDFGGVNTGWEAAVKYYRMNESKFETKDLCIVTTIAIKNKKGNFDNIWIFNNHIDEYKQKDSRYTYGYITVNVLLDKSYDDKKLNIIFKMPDFEDGYHQYILTYENNGKLWKLITRESIRTVLSNVTDIGYCIDTICIEESDKFSFGHGYITEWMYEHCY